MRTKMQLSSSLRAFLQKKFTPIVHLRLPSTGESLLVKMMHVTLCWSVEVTRWATRGGPILGRVTSSPSLPAPSPSPSTCTWKTAASASDPSSPPQPRPLQICLSRLPPYSSSPSPAAPGQSNRQSSRLPSCSGWRLANY